MSSKDRLVGGIGLVMGAGFGFLVGIMIDNLGLGIALGAAFGLLSRASSILPVVPVRALRAHGAPSITKPKLALADRQRAFPSSQSP